MKAAVDLHIHSAHSPCSDNSMTPNNIVNMACLKGLDIIAVTDHNSVENCGSVIKCAADRKILVVPGMEIESSEEIHLVCLFPNIKAAFEIQNTVYTKLPNMENREDIFGQQVIMDKDDNITGYTGRLLLTACDLSIDNIFDMVLGVGGTVIPAHIDRESYSIVSSLGIVPDYLKIKYLEVSSGCDLKRLKQDNPYLDKYSFIKSSDAHTLGDILERETFLELEEISIECLLSNLRKE